LALLSLLFLGAIILITVVLFRLSRRRHHGGHDYPYDRADEEMLVPAEFF
jgi:hypothetical protein